MEDHDPQKQELIDLLEILVRKNRNGKIGTAMGKIKLQYTKVLDFNGNIPTFEEKIQTLKAPF
jgi:replicative DNA helicase